MRLKGKTETIGDRIRKARVEAGLTQRGLAEKIGSSYRTIQQYELGDRQPRIEFIVKIAAALDIPVSDLLDEWEESGCYDNTGNGYAEVHAVKPTDKYEEINRLQVMDDFTYAMHNASRDLSEEDKKLLMDMADRLRKMKPQK